MVHVCKQANYLSVLSEGPCNSMHAAREEECPRIDNLLMCPDNRLRMRSCLVAGNHFAKWPSKTKLCSSVLTSRRFYPQSPRTGAARIVRDEGRGDLSKNLGNVCANRMDVGLPVAPRSFGHCKTTSPNLCRDFAEARLCVLDSGSCGLADGRPPSWLPVGSSSSLRISPLTWEGCFS
jgi:hypothetical protein